MPSSSKADVISQGDSENMSDDAASPTKPKEKTDGLSPSQEDKGKMKKGLTESADKGKAVALPPFDALPLVVSKGKRKSLAFKGDKGKGKVEEGICNDKKGKGVMPAKKVRRSARKKRKLESKSASLSMSAGVHPYYRKQEMNPCVERKVLAHLRTFFGKGNNESSDRGPKLQLSAENEQRLRRLLLNNSSDAATVRPTFEESQSSSLSKAQKTKKLKSIYENLSCEGFFDDQIECALSSLKDGATFEVALDWLCLNLSRTELPVKFRDGLSMHAGGSIGVVSTAQENWNPPADTTTRSDDEVHRFSVITRGRHNDDSLALYEPS
uniref:ATP-dependent RNA helicase DHX29-like UBA domain-containing protein n=1 Tax=Chenopodium quinoa TaxID=63459 RepID=A0A803N846_CHEQI